MINDVRDAKSWLDTQASTFENLSIHLAAVEKAYRERAGLFAGLPERRSDAVTRAISEAADEPGRDLLRETRS